MAKSYGTGHTQSTYHEGMGHQSSSSPRTLLTLAGVVQIVLLIAALRDVRRRPSSLVRGPKGVWVGVSFINFIGPVSYFLFGRKH
ncbi:MAG TPA: PLD nuclease N-terminal domain-containing protein [Beutenbergiaceae bacterium]|nr:PLD nuclease N-terminal domain-containing protein [Beutenbergiaceae bacterium]